jgi:Lon protease-like protein
MAMAVALLRPGYESDYEGRPDIHDVATVGRVETYQELPNGHYHLVLRGLARVRLEELPPSKVPFRQAHATLLDGKHHADAVTRDTMTTLLSTASVVAAAVRRSHPDFALGVAPTDPPYHIADTLADRLVADSALRQDLLETLDVPERIHKLTGHLAELLGQLETDGRHGRGTLQ